MDILASIDLDRGLQFAEVQRFGVRFPLEVGNGSGELDGPGRRESLDFAKLFCKDGALLWRDLDFVAETLVCAKRHLQWNRNVT